jgi:hypothetical protein
LELISSLRTFDKASAGHGKSGSKLSDQLLDGVGIIAKPLPKLTTTPGKM